jgi:ketosteroid isomerase-like protein
MPEKLTLKPHSMKRTLILYALGILFGLPACSGPDVKSALDLETVGNELGSMETNHRLAIEAKDIDAVCQFYSDDLITISPNEPVLYGRDWIPGTMRDLYSSYDFHEDFRLGDLRIIGDRVAASYTFEQKMTPLTGGDQITLTGRGMCILKRTEAGVWQFEWNCYSYDTNPATL